MWQGYLDCEKISIKVGRWEQGLGWLCNRFKPLLVKMQPFETYSTVGGGSNQRITKGTDPVLFPHLVFSDWGFLLLIPLVPVDGWNRICKSPNPWGKFWTTS